MRYVYYVSLIALLIALLFIFVIGIYSASIFGRMAIEMTIEQNEAKISELNYQFLKIQQERKKYAILDKIAYCESGGKQFLNDKVLRGQLNSQDIGKYQINEKYWKIKAEQLGYDIYTLEGNTQMARWIFDNYGTSPWNWSKKCWSQ